jgi:YegS/Rv2252/BmrU family lipid kinase
MEKLCVILNPQAGRGYAGQRRADLERALADAGVAFDLLTTSAQGGAADPAQQALAQGYRCLVAVGGDGTIHEVASTILRSQSETNGSVTLGIVPIGTGSDFIKSFAGFKANDIPGSVARLAAGHTRRIDAGQVHITSESGEWRGYFINNLALGVDALVAAETNRVRWARGLAAYMVGAVRALAAYTARPITLRFDDTTMQQPYLLATVANGRCQGGGFWLTPKAQLDDGQFDLCLVDKLRLDQLVRYLFLALQGAHTGLVRVHMACASRVEVEYSAPALIVTDGEVVATDARRVVAEVMPRALELIVEPSHTRKDHTT